METEDNRPQGSGLEKRWADDYFGQDGVVDHYRRATANVGLWASEELVFKRVFSPTDRILELGTGTGRIAIGLAELGYHHILATDISRGMVAEARRIGQILELPVAFRRADATDLDFEDELFDGAIFGFNGLMQIPDGRNRRKALEEIRRVVRPGGSLVFTTHDRDAPKHRNFWEAEKARWERGEQKPELIDFGDRYEATDWGYSFMHVPTRTETLKLLQETGWAYLQDGMRSTLAQESDETRRFSDECRFWIVQRPLEEGTTADGSDGADD